MNEIVKKLEDAPSAVPSRSSSPGTLELVIRVSAGSEGGQKKRAEVWGETTTGAIRNSRWEMLCDEGKALGGEDEAPPPLAYFSAGLAF
ncbi:MAG: hypothetical protein ACRDYZ_10050 [Acidimicrobiales bacterium]